MIDGNVHELKDLMRKKEILNISSKTDFPEPLGHHVGHTARSKKETLPFSDYNSQTIDQRFSVKGKAEQQREGKAVDVNF